MSLKLEEMVEVVEVQDDTEAQMSRTSSFERPLRLTRELKKHITVSQQLKDTDPLPPETLIPPIHPLINLKKIGEKKKIARIENVVKKIPSKKDKLCLEDSWNKLAEKKTELKELFVNSEKGIKENRASMSRFYEIIKENSKWRPNLLSTIASTREDLEDYRSIERKLKHYVDKYSMFEKFLESVAVADDSWKTVADILARYETLRNTSLECTRILKSELDEASDLRKRMMALSEEKLSKLKYLCNRLNELELLRKESVARRNYWEYTIVRIKNAVSFRLEESIALNKGITDLYHCICKELKVEPTIPSSDVQAQVDFIHKNILFYKEVVTIANGLKNLAVDKENVKEKYKSEILRKIK